jgi:methionyl-tRNA formyltransferase
MKILFLSGNQSQALADWLIQQGEDITYTENRISVEDVHRLNPEIIVSYNYRHILGADILRAVDGRAINLHISYLPYNRGAAPNIWSFLEDTPKGVTIHYIDAGIDTGDIIVQKQVYLDEEKETLRSAYNILHQEIQSLFKDNWEKIKSSQLNRRPHEGGGHIPSKTGLCSNLLSGKNDGIPQSTGLGTDTGLEFRRVTQHDKSDILQWRNHPVVRDVSFNIQIISENEHDRWFEQKLKSTDVTMYLAYLNNDKAGIIRFDRATNRILVSVMLNPVYIGKGLGACLIKKGTDAFLQERPATSPIVAEIKWENTASIKAFMKAGYKASHISLAYQPGHT